VNERGKAVKEEKEELIRDISRLSEEMINTSWAGWCGEWMDMDLTMRQLKGLFLLFGLPPTRMSTLADGLGISLPWCTSVVDRLVKEGMIERREDPLDRRLVLCELSRKGRELVSKLWQSGQLQTEALLERLTLEELRVVAHAMTIFQRAVAAVESRETAPQNREGVTL
jgi:DNA-binding MarR family transcriptional regulator